MYWVIEVVAVGGEAIAVGIYMGFWFPGIPVWWWSLAFGAVLVYVNCRSVTNFGSFEYWFALIKVVAIIAFIVFLVLWRSLAFKGCGCSVQARIRSRWGWLT